MSLFAGWRRAMAEWAEELAEKLEGRWRELDERASPSTGRLMHDEDSEVASVEDSELPYRNRSAVLLRPRQPFVDWLDREAEESLTLAVARAMEDRNVYLLPPWEGSWDWPAVFAASWERMFELELVEWCEDRRRWPKRRTLAMFETWFEIERTSAVVDLVGGPLGPLDASST